ncbi:glycosyltransferase family 4 protein [Nocardioides zeae]|uniref:Glycosyltransferase involved in cell wall biosynthesis n=1 Tax=Nocardioides zeae TaxID=1457234 RepID=A0AAJ1X2K0_9ACTN|nr:glycosyltransferase family 4 protein [Nocardioides zeae]MDQ1106748.1 glycosyltransferase involved in cell wall biosynthesis [Nocardioides zeae]
MSDYKVFLVSAFACHPEMSSEAGIGWQFLLEICEYAAENDAQVIAFMNRRSAAATSVALEERGITCAKLVGIDPPRSLGFLLDPRLTRLEYLAWFIAVRSAIKRLVSQGSRFSVAWHVTFASELLPVPFANLDLGRGFKVWGPVGSSGDWRVFLLKPREGRWLVDAMLQWCRNQVSVAIARRTAREMDLVLTQSPQLKLALGERAQVFPNLVIPADLLPRGTPSTEPKSKGISILAAGHLVPRKRFALLLGALASPELKDASLTIAGAPLPGTSAYLPSLAETLGVRGRVNFLGKVNRKKLLELMSEHDVFAHCAAREGAPGVVGEAATVGIPIVTFNLTGAAAVLRASGGHGIEVDSRNFDIHRLSSALVAAAGMGRNSAPPVWDQDRIRTKVEFVVSGRGDAEASDLA